MFIFTTQLTKLLQELDVTDGGEYWTIDTKIEISYKVVDTKYDDEGYEAALAYESQSDRMFDRSISRDNYKIETKQEIQTPIKHYTLNLAAFLSAKGFEPIIFQEFLVKNFPKKNIIINSSGCTDIATCNISADAPLKKHLILDFANFTRHIGNKVQSNLLREKFREILLWLRPDERMDIYNNAAYNFQTMILEFFPDAKPVPQTAKQKFLSQFQGKKTTSISQSLKRSSPEGGLFMEKGKDNESKELEKKFKREDEPGDQGPPQLN